MFAPLPETVVVSAPTARHRIEIATVIAVKEPRYVGRPEVLDLVPVAVVRANVRLGPEGVVPRGGMTLRIGSVDPQVGRSKVGTKLQAHVADRARRAIHGLLERLRQPMRRGAGGLSSDETIELKSDL